MELLEVAALLLALPRLVVPKSNRHMKKGIEIISARSEARESDRIYEKLYSSIPPFISGRKDDSSGLKPRLKLSLISGSSLLPFSLPPFSLAVFFDSFDEERLNSLSVPARRRD